MRPECCGQNANNRNAIIFNFVPEHKQHLETQIVTMKYYLIIKTSGPIQALRLVPHCLVKNMHTGKPHTGTQKIQGIMIPVYMYVGAAVSNIFKASSKTSTASGNLYTV